MNPDAYARFIRTSLLQDRLVHDGSLCSLLADEIALMISSYLDDADVFSTRNDPVNRYASLTYAHGWLDAGIFLGYLEGIPLQADFCDEGMIPRSAYEALSEKMNRYEQMLGKAAISVIPSASSGSPAFPVAQRIQDQVESGWKNGVTVRLDDRPVSALGLFSYWYGWLDTGVRCGILRIQGRGDLFTTEI